MQKTYLFLAVFSLVALPAFGGVQSASVYEKNLSSADSWSDLSGQLKGRLPSNVVKEFADFSKGISFPGSRRIKNKLVLTQNDGTRVTVEFKKDGVVSFNGKDWRFKPLGTVEEEVTRLALFLNGEKKASASFLGLESAAQASGAGGLGVAAAAFAGANAYKADACGEKNLTDDLNEDCALMAVKMQPILVKAEQSNPEKYVPVGLKCPGENKGTLEYVLRNGNGESQRIRVRYKKNSSPEFITIELANAGEKFERVFQLKVGHPVDDGAEETGDKALKAISPVKSRVCEGDKKYKKRFYEYMASNLSDYPISKRDGNGPESDKKAVEAL